MCRIPALSQLHCSAEYLVILVVYSHPCSGDGGTLYRSGKRCRLLALPDGNSRHGKIVRGSTTLYIQIDCIIVCQLVLRDMFSTTLSVSHVDSYATVRSYIGYAILRLGGAERETRSERDCPRLRHTGESDHVV